MTVLQIYVLAMLALSLSVASAFFLYRWYKNRHLGFFSVFMAIYTLFFFVVPFFYYTFGTTNYKNANYVRLLQQADFSTQLLSLLGIGSCYLLLLLGYNRYRIKPNPPREITYCATQYNSNKVSALARNYADVFFLLSVLSMLMLIWQLGSVKQYLAFGSLTRGLNKSPTTLLRPQFLIFVTLAEISLAIPFMYSYVYRVDRKRSNLVRFILSFPAAAMFLLHNQGRAPIVLFILPFLFIRSIKLKTKTLVITSLLLLAALLSLNYLDAVFRYLSHGIWRVDRSRLLDQFLIEFLYPYSNFTLKDQLLEQATFRYGYDYIVWPITMVPEPILQFLGLSKTFYEPASNLSTYAYSAILKTKPMGGIPLDFLTFNYWQFGWLTLIPACLFTGLLLRKGDRLISRHVSAQAMGLVILRLSFSMINMINNAEIAAIIKNRLDVMVLLVFFILVSYQLKKVPKDELAVGKGI